MCDDIFSLYYVVVTSFCNCTKMTQQVFLMGKEETCMVYSLKTT